MSPVYEAKGKMTEYLMEKCQESGMEWTCICCGTWVDWYVLIFLFLYSTSSPYSSITSPLSNGNNSLSS